MENNAGTLVNDWGTYEDGILTMNRSMGYHGTTCFAGQKFNLEANKTYTLSATVYLTGTNATSNVILGFAGESNPNVTITKEVWTKVSRTVTFTQYKENVRVFIQPSNTGNVLQIKEIMLCEGTDTNYSPYTDNPIELCKIGNYQDKLLQSKGNNLFNENVYNDTSLYAIQSLYFAYVKMPDSFKRKFYGNMVLTGTNQNLVFGFSDSHIGINTRILNNGTLNRNVLYDFTNAENVYLIIGNSQYVNIARDIPLIYNNYKIMISENANEPYEPYGVGKWYIKKNINKVVLNGTETWKKTSVSASNSNAFWNQYTNLNIPLGKYGQKYCDRFEYQEKQWSQSTPNHLAENTNYTSDLSILFNVDSTIATTVSEWTTWLSNNNTTVYYQLANPTYTEITDSYLLEQLNGLLDIELYENLCYANWVGTKEPTMKLTYYVDTDKILEKLREE